LNGSCVICVCVITAESVGRSVSTTPAEADLLQTACGGSARVIR